MLSLLNREYSSHYAQAAVELKGKSQELIGKYQSLFRNEGLYKWNTFKESDEPRSELEQAQNAFFRYEFNTLTTL